MDRGLGERVQSPHEGGGVIPNRVNWLVSPKYSHRVPRPHYTRLIEHLICSGSNYKFMPSTKVAANSVVTTISVMN